MCKLQQEHHSFAHQSLTPTNRAVMSKTAAADQQTCQVQQNPPSLISMARLFIEVGLLPEATTGICPVAGFSSARLNAAGDYT